MTCFANDFEPSIMAARRLGPKQLSPAPRSASPSPATSGASGPTIDKRRSQRPGQVRHRADVGEIGRVDLGQCGDARVARRRVQAGHAGIGGERPRQRVLTATGAEEEDSHAASLPAPVASPARGRRCSSGCWSV